MTMTIQEQEVKTLLKKFPFYKKNKSRQKKVLSGYLVLSLGHNKQETAKKLDVNRQTISKIEEEWKELTHEEALRLIEFLREEYGRQHFIETEPEGDQ